MFGLPGGTSSSESRATDARSMASGRGVAAGANKGSVLGSYQSGAKPFFGGAPKLWPLVVVAVIAVIILKPKLKKK